MSNNSTEADIDIINDLSLQILSLLEEQSEHETVENTDIPPVSTLTEPTDYQAFNKQLLTLTQRRDVLVHQLFQNNTQEQLTVEHERMNKLVLLDKYLNSKSKLNMQLLAEQVKKIRKSKQVRSAYNKY
ncbi:MAG: hypothetical protein ACPG46_04025 [Thalassotalea sp.]